MKLTMSGVAFSAAVTRSPSFSRSASSVTITIRPLATSLMTSSIVSNCNACSASIITADTITSAAALGNPRSLSIGVLLESRPIQAIKVNRPTWRKSIWRLRACRDNRFWTIHVVIASLKFCFQVHFKLRKIDQVPPDKVPTAIFSGFMLEAGDQMNGVIANLVRRDFRFEIEGAKTAISTAKGIKFWVEIKDTRGRKIDNPKVRITGALNFVPGSRRKIAAQPGRGIEQFSQQIFHLTAYFVDARDLLNRTVGRIHPPHRLVKGCTYLLDYALVSSVFSINSQNMLARGVENHLAKCNAAQLSIFVKQPGN